MCNATMITFIELLLCIELRIFEAHCFQQCCKLDNVCTCCARGLWVFLYSFQKKKCNK